MHLVSYNIAYEDRCLAIFLMLYSPATHALHSSCLYLFVDLGDVEVWAARGERPTVEHWKGGSYVESYTVTVLTMLDDKFPLTYAIKQGSSNSSNFVKFWLEDAASFLHEGDIIIGDNMNYHCKGWSAEVTHYFLNSIGAKYYMLPKYSPEFNPSEKVFSFLKHHLRKKHSVHDDLLLAIADILNKITPTMMLGWYEHCGWF